MAVLLLQFLNELAVQKAVFSALLVGEIYLGQKEREFKVQKLSLSLFLSPSLAICTFFRR